MLVRRLRTVARPFLCPLCHARLVSTVPAARPLKKSARATTLPPPAIDLAALLANPTLAKKNLVDRAYPLAGSVVDDIARLELEASALRKELQRARERRNAASAASAREEGRDIKLLLKRLEGELSTRTSTLDALALQLPNTSHPSSPIGDESAARTIRTFGPPIPTPPPTATSALDHLHLSSPAQLSWTDFPSASLISGPSWPLLTNTGALLELALTSYAISTATSRGFAPVLPPDVVRADVAERCGFHPRDGDAQQTYFLSDGTVGGDTSLVLVGTAEVPLVAMSAATTYREDELPIRRVGLGRAFRAEAGARGAESRGLYRVHQFSKVEMVVVCAEEDSGRILEELRSVQEQILGSLGLSLRVLEMPTQELGASAHRKYDIEGWMPGRGKWGELSSASNCTSFQSRRLSIRYRPTPLPPPPTTNLETLNIPTPAAMEATAAHPQLAHSGQAKTRFAHTLNATAAAIPRLIVAILENGAVLGADGSVEKVRLPGVLRRFWLGSEDGVEWVAEGEPLRLES